MVETNVIQQHRSASPSPPPFTGFGQGPEFKPKETRSCSPPTLPFHGFGQGPSFEPGEANSDVGTQPKSKGGRPKGKGRSQVDILAAGQGSPPPGKRLTLTPTNQKPRDQKKREESVLPKTNLPGATLSRPTYYLVGKAPSCFFYSKLPKTVSVLGRFLDLRKNRSKAQAAKVATQELIQVWLHHFGPVLVLGVGRGPKQKASEGILISDSSYICKCIGKLAKRWSKLEVDSRSPGRSASKAFQDRELQMKIDLDMPFNISRNNPEHIIKSAGILDWREEAEYLQGQLRKIQVGCISSFDKRQQKRDELHLKEEQTKANTEEKKRARLEELQSISDIYTEQDTQDQHEMDMNMNDEDFSASDIKKKKIDIMGKISVTCDARNISLRDRIFVASSVCNAVGIPIKDTNISLGTSWYQGSKVRLDKADEIKNKFVCPDKVVAHWDGKTLTLRGRIESKRVAIYISGVDGEHTRKLLGIPECVSGQGKDEFEVTKKFLVQWKVKEQLVGMVFDTTASNSGQHSGACRCIAMQYSEVFCTEIPCNVVQMTACCF